MADNITTNDLPEVPYVKITCKLILQNNVPVRKSSLKIRRIHYFINKHQDSIKSAYLKVSYSPTDRWLINEYDCDNVDELRKALLACMEPELFEYLTQGSFGKSPSGQKLGSEEN